MNMIGEEMEGKKITVREKVTKRVIDSLACPGCRGGLSLNGSSLKCQSCGASYVVKGGIVDLRPSSVEKNDDADLWSQHWSGDRQQQLVQRFFSMYRKVVFARAVRAFINRYFDETGIFVEAGSGTSETSVRINKNGGERTLVAADVVPTVLSMCHPVMDVRVCSDIFRLPFRDGSVDGIWNVGVMEHFTQAQIDMVMGEFHRVMRAGGRVIMFWPGADSVPQKMLQGAEKIINTVRRDKAFRFHIMPDEVSRLKSRDEGLDILQRNGFKAICVDYGLSTLLAFKILVGEKAATAQDTKHSSERQP